MIGHAAIRLDFVIEDSVVRTKWFSQATNAQGWKVHLKNQHSVTVAATAASDRSSQVLADDDGTTSS
jgi:hypothetical protein